MMPELYHLGAGHASKDAHLIRFRLSYIAHLGNFP